MCLAAGALTGDTSGSLNSSDLLCNGMVCGDNMTAYMDKEAAARMYSNLSENDTILWKSPAEEYWQYVAHCNMISLKHFTRA